MTKLFMLPIVASLILGSGVALAKDNTTSTIEKVNAIERVAKPERVKSEKPKETHRERCLRKNNGDESKCRKPTRLERCIKKENLTKEQCEQKFREQKAQARAGRPPKSQ